MTRIRPVTQKQLRVLEFIEKYCREHNGTSPSFREIRDGCGYKNVRSIEVHIDLLQLKGLVTRGEWRQSRSVKSTRGL